MADDVLEVVLKLDDSQYQKRIDAAGRATRGFGGALNSVQSGVGGANTAFRTSVPILDGIINAFQVLAASVAAVGVAYAGFVVHASGSAASFEQIKLGLAAFAGSAEETERQLLRLEEVAKMPGLGFRDAVQASTRLQAVGFSAGLAERGIMAFGNALATVGKGKADLDGVIMALSQIVSKGVVSAEEINQLAERLPQIRTAMQAAFGTASSEMIQKMGISAEDFVTRMIGAFEMLPRAKGGIQNAIDNLTDAFDRATISFGGVLNQYVAPAVEKLATFFEQMTKSGTFAAMAKELTNVVERVTSIMGADGLPDLLVRGASLALAIIENIPKIIESVLTGTKTFMDGLGAFVGSIIASINSMIEAIKKIPYIGDWFSEIQSIVAPSSFGIAGPIMDAMAPVVEDIKNRSNAIYESSKKAMEKSGFTPDGGGFTTSFGQGPAIPLLQRIANSSERMENRIKDLMLGGGAAMEAAVNARNLGQWSGGSGGDRWDRMIIDAFNGKLQSAAIGMARAGTIKRGP